MAPRGTAGALFGSLGYRRWRRSPPESSHLRSREGAVYCWGLNHFAQLGDGSRASRLVPVLSHGVAGVAALDVAYDHSCVETESGSRLCWGLDVYGEAAGDGRAGIGQTAEPVAGVRDAVQVVASLIHTCSLDAQGAVNCWEELLRDARRPESRRG